MCARVCRMGFLKVFLPLMKVSLAVPARIGCSQASGGLTPRGLALGVTHSCQVVREQHFSAYNPCKIHEFINLVRYVFQSPEIFLLFLLIYSLDY